MPKQWLGERKTARLQGHDEDYYLPEKKDPQYKWVGERKMAVRRELQRLQWEASQSQQINYPQPTQAGGSQIPGAPPIQQNPNLPYGYMYSDKDIQYVTDPKTGLNIKVKPGMVVRNPAIPYGTLAPVVEAPLSFATLDQAKAGEANWTDVSTDDRKKLLSDPNFYKSGQITKYEPWMQQQILADPSFQWDQLPKWQQKFFEISSNPKIMAAPLALAGGMAGSVLGPVGFAAGAYAGWKVGVKGAEDYNPTKGFSEQPTTSAKLMRILNVLSEYAEMYAGYTGQVSDAAIAGMKGNEQAAQAAKDMLFDPAARQAAVEAGRLTYEYSDSGGRYLTNLFQLLSGETELAQRGQDFVLGAVSPIDKEKVLAHDPLTGKEIYVTDVMQVLQDARHEIRAEINAGRDPDEVVMQHLQNANVYVGSQLQDLVWQSTLDPLNVLPGLGVGAAKNIAAVTGNKVAAQALSQAKGLNEAARRYKTSVQTGQALIIDPKFQVDKMGLFSRMAAGVNKVGEVKAGSLIPSETGLLTPVKDKAGFLRSMVEQTPHSRAETGANMFYENIAALLTSFEDPHEAGKYLKALANSDMETWAELGSRFAESPEFYTVLPALKEFNISKLEGIVQQWDLAQPNRDAMLRMANLLGEQPAKWLEDTAKRGTFEQDFQRLKEKVRNNNNAEAQALKGDVEAGRITAETLKQIVDLFTGEGALSWHAGQWKALMLDALGTHFDEWVTKRLMLDKSLEATSAFYRTTALMKQAQSILLLGGSPGYAITNGLSNMVHRAVTGIYGYMTPNQINTFLDRMGVTPARMEEGVGIGGQVEQTAGRSQVKTEAMTKAVRGKGALTTAKDTLSKISRGMPMSKLSSWFEKIEGRQGFAIAMKQFWSQSWRRGVGFKTMRPELVNVIKEMGIAPERIYAAIEAGMNQGEIEKALFGRYEGVQARALIHDAAQKTGLSASQAAEMLEKTGALDTLDNYLKGQTTKDGVQAAFTRAERVAQDYIDMQTGEDLKASAEAVKQRVGLEGAASALDVAQKATSAYTDVWMDHYARFGEVMTDLKLLDDPAMRSKAIDYNYQLSDVEFRRLSARHATNYTGIFEAWGLSGNEHALNVLAAIGESDAAMRDAYRGMRELRKGFFDTYRNDWDNPGKWDKWDADNKTIDRLFKQGFADKHTAEVKMGKSLAAIYEGMYGPAAGEAALKWWEDVTKFNDEIVKREQDFRKRLEGLTKDQRDIAKQKYYSETKIMLIAEADRINGEGIARLERVIKGGRGTADGGPVSPATPPTPLAPDQSPAPLSPSTATSPQIQNPSADLGGRVQQSADEINALLAAAEQRKGAEAKVAAERLAGIWDVAEEYWGRGAKYSRGILQDKFALLNAIRKVEYGGIPDLKGLTDSRLTPELVRSVMEARKVIKATQATEAAVTAFNQPEPVKKRNLDPNNINLLQAIAGHGGLNMAKAKDLLGEKRPRTMPGVFTKKAFNKGWDITDMARYLAGDGFEIDLYHPDDLGGAKQATDLLNRAIIGDKIYPMGHDYSKALDAAEKAYIETFDMDAIPEVPFDQTLWQTEFTEAVTRGDLTKIWGMIGDVPETFDPNVLQDYVRIADETAARVEAGARDAQVKENLREAQAVISEAETRAEAVTTRHLLKEKFQEAFGLDEAQAQAWMELSDSIGGWYAKRTGESADAFYSRYYEDVVKADGGQGTVDGGLEQANANRIWYSKLTQTVEGINQPRMTVEQLRGALVKAGVKADEIKWMGLDDFIQGKKQITKAEALEFLRENQVQVEEVTKGNGRIQPPRLIERSNNPAAFDQGLRFSATINGDTRYFRTIDEANAFSTSEQPTATKFSQRTLPGGENYREVLFTLPVEKPKRIAGDYTRVDYANEVMRPKYGENYLERQWTPEEEKMYESLPGGMYAKYEEPNNYKSQHWNEPNVLAHVRLDDRVDAQGKRVLFVEEVQSDWHQAGREKGYDTTFKKAEKLVQDFLDNRPGSDKTIKASQVYEKNLKAWGASQDVIEAYKITQDAQYFRGIPDAPFSKTWHELVMKRVLRMAAEEGYDRVGWTTGEQQAARYDLAKQVDYIDWRKIGDGRYDVNVKLSDQNGGKTMDFSNATPEYLKDNIGKDATDRILSRGDSGRLESEADLKVGGEGMKGFYDKMLPAFMDKYGKKWGAKTGETKILSGKDYQLEQIQSGIVPPEYKERLYENVHSVDVTPAMRESVMQGQPLFQTAKGAVTFDAEGIKATIHAFEARDFTTLVHENGHVFRRMLADVAERTENAQVKADLATIEKWAGVKDGKWERAHEEKFARGFEKYITEGKAPTPALARAFESFRRWMLEIYKTITGSVIDVKITDEVRGVFDRMLGGADDGRQTTLFQTDDRISQKGDKTMSSNRIYTSEFKNWFGDWENDSQNASKVVDEEGKPARVFHGTNEVFDTFSSELLGSKTHATSAKKAFFFTSRPETAASYLVEIPGNLPKEAKAQYIDVVNNVSESIRDETRVRRMIEGTLWHKNGNDIYNFDIDREMLSKFVDKYDPTFKVDLTDDELIKQMAKRTGINPFGLPKGKILEAYVNEIAIQYANMVASAEIGKAPNVKIVYLSIKNPFVFDFEERGLRKTELPRLINKAIKNGNDGIIFKNLSDGGSISTHYAVFHPEQIKSATSFDSVKSGGSGGTLSGNTPNILFQEADQPFGAYDAASGYHPQGEALDQGWSQHVRPLLEAMQEGAVRQLGDRPLEGAVRDMSPEGQAMLRKYMKQVQGEMASTKLATVRWGENQRDFALLNYNKRYGFDRLAEALYPYQFYYTRSLMTWAARTLDKPALYSNYARLRMQQDRYERDIPERLRGKIKISAPWLPEWMGGNLYIDPMTQLFFPANLLRPFERAQQDKNYQMIEAERILQEWTADGTYSESQAAQAAQTQSGTVWERALAEAQIRRESEIANPFDFFSTMFGPAWYLSTPLSLAGIKVFPNQGEPGKVNTTPLYNTIRGLDTVTQGTWAEPIGNMIGMLGKPEEWLRKKLELPEFGEYGDYYIDRQLANMVAEGKINSEQAQIAMIERQGEFFDEAKERVKMEVSLRVPTMGALYAGLHEGAGAGTKAFLPSLFGAGLLPAGELEYRGLKQEWNEAWKRADAGDTTAVTGFFDKYPEYEAYLAKNKEPEERLRSFLVGQIWDGYMALGTTNKKQASAEMGDLFKQSFLDKETRSYETLDVETLTRWAQMLNKTTPTPSPSPNGSAPFGEGGKTTTPKLNLYDQSVTMVTDEYFSQRTKKFPNFYEEQTGYYALPKSERNAYLLKTPGLKAYWDWKDSWYKKYPQYVPVFNGQVFKQVDTSGWPPGLVDYVISYAYTGKKLPSGAMKALEQQWIVEGMPMDDLKSWIDAVVVPAMLYGE